METDKNKEKENNLDTKKETKSVTKENVETGSSAQTKNEKFVEWSSENEMIMVEWCDVAQCYKWLNTRAHNKYKMMNAWFTIPAITLSTISGTASFAQASLPVSMQSYAPMAIGTLNILIGILTTVQQYLKISELNEAHRVSAISWDKFARNIRIELAKAPAERMDAGPFIKICRQEFDRLMETSPSVNEKVVQEFFKAFSGKEGSIERKRFEALKKPDICNIIISANEYRHPWYLDESTNTGTDNVVFVEPENEEYIRQKEKELLEKENTLRNKENAEKDKQNRRENAQKMFQKGFLELSKKLKLQSKKLEDYVQAFQGMYGRKPIVDEIERHAESLIESDEIERETLVKFLANYKSEGVLDLV
jgi:hypothetical protein